VRSFDAALRHDFHSEQLAGTFPANSLASEVPSSERRFASKDCPRQQEDEEGD
jgi:hypothetical protein